MHTARLTVLMPPDRKAAIERKAAAQGISAGELVRRAVDDYEEITPEEEAELAALVEEVNAAIPKMHASLDHSIRTLEALHEEMDAFLREKGIRK